MARYEVRCEVEVPDELQVPDKQIEEWVRFSLNIGELRCDNPLQDRDFEAAPFTVEVNRKRC